MSLVNITNVQYVGENPTAFSNEFAFEITFECNGELKNDLEWRMIYMGCLESGDYRQELESISVGPIPVGFNKFVFNAPAPKPQSFPTLKDVVDLHVLSIECDYNDETFVSIGYYVNNEYIDEELKEKHKENPLAEVRVDRLQRNILVDKPKVKRDTIKWDVSTGVDSHAPVNMASSSEPHNTDDMMVQ